MFKILSAQTNRMVASQVRTYVQSSKRPSREHTIHNRPRVSAKSTQKGATHKTIQINTDIEHHIYRFQASTSTSAKVRWFSVLLLWKWSLPVNLERMIVLGEKQSSCHSARPQWSTAARARSSRLWDKCGRSLFSLRPLYSISLSLPLSVCLL